MDDKPKTPQYAQMHEIVGLAVASKSMPATYVANHLAYESEAEEKTWSTITDEIKQLFGSRAPEILGNLIHSGLFFFETDADNKLFYAVFAKEGVESSAVYACTYNKDGTCESENT